MDPTDPSTAQQAIPLLSEALKGLPVLAVMWYMLRDVRTAVSAMASKVNALELTMASNDNTARIGFINEKLTEAKLSMDKANEELKTRVHDIEKQLPKIWGKVGDRPEDVINRCGGK